MAEDSGSPCPYARADRADQPALLPGGDRAAARALRAGQAIFTAAQVAYLLQLAYDSGRTAAYREDLAELHSVWEDKAERRATYDQRIAGRMASYAAAGEKVGAKLGRPDGYTYRGGPVDWDTGKPARLRAVA